MGLIGTIKFPFDPYSDSGSQIPYTETTSSRSNSDPPVNRSHRTAPHPRLPPSPPIPTPPGESLLPHISYSHHLYSLTPESVNPGPWRQRLKAFRGRCNPGATHTYRAAHTGVTDTCNTPHTTHRGIKGRARTGGKRVSPPSPYVWGLRHSAYSRVLRSSRAVTVAVQELNGVLVGGGTKSIDWVG